MFGFISVVVVKGACVRDCRGLGLYTVGTAGGECVGGRGSIVKVGEDRSRK
jgi:hypothetical protein